MSSKDASKSSTKTDFKNLSAALGDKLSTKRIESPIARYNSIGQLTCIVCNQLVKSELVWTAHINSRSHLENKNKLKSTLAAGDAKQQTQQVKKQQSATLASSKATTKVQQQQQQQQQQQVFKRPMAVESTSTPLQHNNELNHKRQKLDNLVEKTRAEKTDTMQSQSTAPTVTTTTDNDNKSNHTITIGNTTSLPEGFFDDPDMDDKVRGVSREANLEAEFEEFKKIIQQEEFKSDVIVEQDDALRDVDRDLQEVDELIGRWNRIESLHQRREAILAASKLKKEAEQAASSGMDHSDAADDDDSDDDLELENILGLALRSKNRC